MMHNIGVTLAASLFIYLAYLAGDLFLRSLKFDFESRRGRILYRILFGYGAWSIGGFVLALAGFFNAPVLRVLAILLVVASGETVTRHYRRLFAFIASPSRWVLSLKNIFRGNTFLKIIIAAWLLGNFLIVFVPLTGHDTLDYHFPIMRDLVQSGRLTLTTAIPSYEYLPVLGEIFYAVSMLFFGNSTAPFIFQLLQYSTLILLVLMLYDFFAEKVRFRFLVLAVPLLTLAIMDLEREVLHGGYVDVLAFLFGVGGILLVLAYCVGDEFHERSARFGFVLFGIAAGIKYLSLVFVAIAGVFLLATFLVRRLGFRRIVNHAAAYAAILFIIAGFWYVKNAFTFGNPVYPMASDAQATSDIGVFLVERTLPNLIIFPLYRYGQWFVQEDETSSRLISLAYFIATYLLIGLFLLMRRKLSRLEWFLAAFVQLYLIALFFTSHQYRFLIPASIMMAPLLVLLFDRLLSVFQERLAPDVFVRVSRFSSIAMRVLFLGILIGNIHYFEVKFRYITGSYSREEYIEVIGGQ